MSAPSGPTIEFRSRPGRLWCGVLGSVLFVLAGIWMASGAAPERVAFTRFMGVACVLFFGWTTWLWARRAIHAGEVVLTIDAAGVFDRRLTTAPVPWADITGVSTWSTAGTTLVVLGVTEACWSRENSVRPLARRTRIANASLGADGLSIHAMPIGVKPAVLLRLIQEEAARHGRQLA